MSFTKEEEDKERYKEVRDQIIELKKEFDKFNELSDKLERRLNYIIENYFR